MRVVLIIMFCTCAGGRITHRVVVSVSVVSLVYGLPKGRPPVRAVSIVSDVPMHGLNTTYSYITRRVGGQDLLEFVLYENYVVPVLSRTGDL